MFRWWIWSPVASYQRFSWVFLNECQCKKLIFTGATVSSYFISLRNDVSEVTNLSSKEFCHNQLILNKISVKSVKYTKIPVSTAPGLWYSILYVLSYSLQKTVTVHFLFAQADKHSGFVYPTLISSITLSVHSVNMELMKNWSVQNTQF